MKATTFTVAQVTALCGGKLPCDKGLSWERVERFELRNGVMHPCIGEAVLPELGIRFEIRHPALPRLMEPYDWWNYSAPVCAPAWVREEVRRTKRSVDWQNVFFDGTICYCIFYRTRTATEEEDEDGIITHALPGSYEVSKTEWLRRISDLDKPLPHHK